MNARPYVIFRGSAPDSAPGVDTLLSRFADEGEARHAFRSVRLAHRDGWAELVRVGADGERAVLCWFGDHVPAVRPTAATVPRGVGRIRGILARRHPGRKRLRTASVQSNGS